MVARLDLCLAHKNVASKSVKAGGWNLSCTGAGHWRMTMTDEQDRGAAPSKGREGRRSIVKRRNQHAAGKEPGRGQQVQPPLMPAPGTTTGTTAAVGSQQPSRFTSFPGMRAAKRWGLRLARDFDDHMAKKLAWREVDKGALLYGPPGTGKSTFAALLAEHMGVNFVYTSYTDWQTHGDGHLGDVLQCMRNVFQEAIAKAPCILFIEEIDALSSRNAAQGRNREWWVAIVNAALECFDKLKHVEGVIVVGATNHPDKLDPALVRSGRLDRRVEIGLPDTSEIGEIFRFYLKHDLPSLSLDAVAMACAGLTGADIEQITRDARREARAAGGRAMLEDDLFLAIRQGAPERPAEYVRRVALHELGHAVVAIVVGHASEGTVSIVERGARLGMTFMHPRVVCPTREALEGQIMVHCGGLAAERVFLGAPSAGSGGGDDSDLVKATSIAIDIVLAFGLSRHGRRAAYPAAERNTMFLAQPQCQDEVHEILAHAEEQACNILSEHRESIQRALGALLTRKGIDFAEIRAFLDLKRGAPRANAA